MKTCYQCEEEVEELVRDSRCAKCAEFRQPNDCTLPGSATYDEWQALGRQVRAGEKASSWFAGQSYYGYEQTIEIQGG